MEREIDRQEEQDRLNAIRSEWVEDNWELLKINYLEYLEKEILKSEDPEEISKVWSFEKWLIDYEEKLEWQFQDDERI